MINDDLLNDDITKQMVKASIHDDIFAAANIKSEEEITDLKEEIKKEYDNLIDIAKEE